MKNEIICSSYLSTESWYCSNGQNQGQEEVLLLLQGFYGRSDREVTEISEIFIPKIEKAQLEHLLWPIMYLKLYVPIDNMVFIVLMVKTSKTRLYLTSIYGNVCIPLLQDM